MRIYLSLTNQNAIYGNISSIAAKTTVATKITRKTVSHIVFCVALNPTRSS